MNGKIETAQQKLGEALAALEEAKPNDRSATDRYVAVTITDLEKIIAYFEKYVIGG